MKQEQDNKQETQEQGKSMRTQGEWDWKQKRGNNKYEYAIITEYGRYIALLNAEEPEETETVRANAAYICEAVNNYERLKLESSKLSSTIQELKEVKELCAELINVAGEVLTEWHSKRSNFTKSEPAYLQTIRTLIENNKQLDTK
jgi:hypothetical protein